jgi:hypothetical protein
LEIGRRDFFRLGALSLFFSATLSPFLYPLKWTKGFYTKPDPFYIVGNPYFGCSQPVFSSATPEEAWLTMVHFRMEGKLRDRFLFGV